MEQGFCLLDFQQGIDELSVESRKRFYTYVAVSYATLEEIRPLLSSAKEYAYLLHDKDVDTDGNPRGNHYHIMLAYESNQSYKKLLKLVKSEKNTFVQGLKRCVGNMMDYFTHSTKASEHKYQYDADDIVYSDRQYWEKRLGWKSSEETLENALNDTFIDELLAENFDEVDFARKYGRDFIKNKEKYMSFRMEHKNDDLLEFAVDELQQCKVENEDLTNKNVLLTEELRSIKDNYTTIHKQREEYREQLNESFDRICELETIVEKLNLENQTLLNILKEIRNESYFESCN